MKRYTNEDFIKAVKESHSYSEVCRKLGIVSRGGNLNTVKKKIYLLKLDDSHFTGQAWNKGLTIVEYPKLAHKDLCDILVENRPTNSDNLRKRLIQEGLKMNKCECCGLSEWNGKEIPLELHHVNGKHDDNRIENLMVICPNCHAQTYNYGNKGGVIKNNILYIGNTVKNQTKTNSVCAVCGKKYNKKDNKQKYCSSECFHKSKRKIKCDISKELLIELFNKYNSFLSVGKYLGISDNAVRKWCKKFGLPTTKKETI